MTSLPWQPPTPTLASETIGWRPTPPRSTDAGRARDDLAEVEALALAELGDEIELGRNLPGTRLRVVSRLGDGGGGVVYRGEHVDLERPVAIKVVRGDGCSESARAALLAEARRTSAIDSPHVVKVIDYGELPGGRVWYAMELLAGATVDEVLVREGRIAAGRAIDLLRMACKALAEIHGNGLVHRDIKPSNMMILKRRGRDHLSVVDLGIATMTGVRPASVTGTPEYMAREQIVRGVLDARTDVYALGCCAYELLTGRALVQGCTVQQILMRHSDGVEPEFGDADDVPVPLQAVVRRCLAVDPAARYADAIELEAALCEAQIAAGIVPTRDDLPLPEVETDRRTALAEGFATLVRPASAPPRRRWAAWVPSAALLAAAMVPALLFLPSDAASVTPVSRAVIAPAAVLAVTDMPQAIAHAEDAVPDELAPDETASDDAVTPSMPTPPPLPATASRPRRGRGSATPSGPRAAKPRTPVREATQPRRREFREIGGLATRRETPRTDRRRLRLPG